MNLNYSSSSEDEKKPAIKQIPINNFSKPLLPNVDQILGGGFLYIPQISKIEDEKKELKKSQMFEAYNDVAPPPISLKINENASRYARYNLKRKASFEYECPVIEKFIKLDKTDRKEEVMEVEKPKETQKNKFLLMPPQLKGKRENLSIL